MGIHHALIELADDHLILGHRLSEWCGHAPMLEEDLAMPNMALDLIGTAPTLYDHAGKIEGKNRSEDDIAYFRDEREYRNCLLVERPNDDFAHTILRQFYFAAFMRPFWLATLEITNDETVRGVAGKAEKEMAYHIRHCGEWIIRLGDGTNTSAQRMSDAVDALNGYIDELFDSSEAAVTAENAGALPTRADIRPAWNKTIADVFLEAQLAIPKSGFAQRGGRSGNHTEGLGHLLAEMQSVARAHPGAIW